VGDFIFQQRCIERIQSVIKTGTTVLFVSHNLKAVTEVCPRTMLLEHGKVVAIDQTDVVARRYLGALPEAEEGNKPVYVSKACIRDRAGEQSTFESGDTAWVDVEITAQETVERLSVVIWFTDDTQYMIFSTSTERLGLAPISLLAGERYRCTFELKLNMAHGSFHLGSDVFRYDRQMSYDRHNRSATIFVGSTMAVRGAVNCFPTVIEAEKIANSSRLCEV
jgi:lipopolysaccharide transport system ATP-binding protein